MKNYKKGFTLIELLVVIAIIGILSSIVVVNLSSAKNKASRASALTTVSGLGTEFILCQDETISAIVGPETTTGGTAAEWVCKAAVGDSAAHSGHSVIWPSLANTGGYCYSQNGTSCITPVADGAALTSPFYLFDTDNTRIDCSFSTTANLVCI